MMFRAKKPALPATAALLTAVVLAVSGCGGAPADQDGPVTLRFSWWGSDTRHKLTEKLIAAFEAENPNIKVKGEYGDWSGYWDKLATQVASQDAPDVIQMDAAYLGEYSGRGALLELKDVDLSKFDQPVADSGKVDGKQYAVTSGVNAMVVLANPALVAASGVALPDDKTWTWDDLDSTAADITKASADGVYGTGQVNSDAAANLWFRQHGKSLFTSEGKLGFDEAALTEWYEYQARMRDSKAVPPASIITEDASASIDQQGLATGRFVMNMYWSNQLGALSKASGQDLAILRPPSVAGKAAEAQQFYKSSMFWSASSRTKHPAEAQKFIDFVTNNAAAGDIGLADRGIPANSDIRAAVADKLTPADAKTAKFIDEISSQLGGAVPVPPAGGSAAVEALTRYSLEVHFSRLSPAEAAKRALSEAQSALL
ncbi:ABC transporter substrate-binding protein [Arthrobacter sp. Leaf141]|uniref:ABC transporter substrate-binding protein n=1 Tax=Arthrobacter sp. Leaf141 TaxID=1736273 RepID=UPI0009EB227F|nr:sugar ABC transporter substrate-binding protein [Arthrobacter sp. Leaf141]